MTRIESTDTPTFYLICLLKSLMTPLMRYLLLFPDPPCIRRYYQYNKAFLVSFYLKKDFIKVRSRNQQFSTTFNDHIHFFLIFLSFDPLIENRWFVILHD